uniref:Uncharacterized protein n=1 Tax=Pipistrellus kuhlii TaxID=59472 RepID=A0A7J7T2A3_PIPKU|nr:hypothetical protein mPipKuh1_011688 [Pipistrellus kuhlii]
MAAQGVGAREDQGVRDYVSSTHFWGPLANWPAAGRLSGREGDTGGHPRPQTAAPVFYLRPRTRLLMACQLTACHGANVMAQSVQGSRLLTPAADAGTAPRPPPAPPGLHSWHL